MIMREPESKLSEYVHENIQSYMDIILNMSSEKNSDTEECVVDILNNENIKPEQKSAYIKKMDTVISSLKSVKDNSLWALLMDQDVILHSGKNILSYFSINEGFDERLIRFVNSCENSLDFSEIEKNMKQEMLNATIKLNAINNKQYEQIIESIGYAYKEFTFEDIEDSKIHILINNDVIKMTEENLEFIRKYYQVELDYFIKKYIEKYIEIMTNELFSLEELLKILEWDVSDDFKLSMLEFAKEKISIIRKHYSPKVCNYILEYNRQDSDLESLFITFKKWDTLVQYTIFNLAINHMSMIVELEKENKLPEDLKNKILQSNELEVEDKTDLMIVIMPKLKGKDEVIRLLEIIQIDELDQYKKIFIKDKQPKLKINSLNEKVLSSLKKNHWLKEYEEDSKGEIYKITKNRFNKSR